MDMTSYRELNTTTSTRPTNGSNGTQGVAIRELNAYVKQEAGFIPALLAEINKVMVGQEALVERVLIALLADGHVLLEGVPGLAKTLLSKPWRRPSRPISPASSSRPTCCRPTWSAR